MAETLLATREDEARAALDRHVVDMVDWHFDPATGTPFWLDWVAKAGWDPRREIRIDR